MSARRSPGVPRTKALQRAVSVLHAVAAEPGASASSLGRAIGLPRATMTRTLRTLADAGLVDDVDGGWMLGYELLRLARDADPFRAVIGAAGRPLDQLRDVTGETALLAVPVGRTEMEIVLQLDAAHIVGVTNWVGVHPPLHASSAGKLLLAELSEPELDAWLTEHALDGGTDTAIHDAAALRRELQVTRQRGWAAIVDELEVGLVSLSAAVRDRDGALVGMVGVSGPTFRLGPRRRREVLAHVLEAAATSTVHLRGPAPQAGR
jgi:DNA-binding IclR family transcriptional regulator